MEQELMELIGSPISLGKPCWRQIHKLPPKVRNPMEGDSTGCPLKLAMAYRRWIHKPPPKVGNLIEGEFTSCPLRFECPMYWATNYLEGKSTLANGDQWGPATSGKPYGAGVHRPAPKVAKLYRRADHEATTPYPYRKVNRLPPKVGKLYRRAGHGATPKPPHL